MVFRNYERQVYAKLEGTGGTAVSITTDADFIETVNPQFTITPLQFDRQPKTQTFTMAPMTVAGLGKDSNQPASTVEFTFAVELCGPGSGAVGNVPEFDSLLRACGLEQVDVFKYAVTKTTYGVSSSENTFFDRENVDAVSSGPYSASIGECFGDNAYGDADFFVTTGTAPGGTDTTLVGQRSGAKCTLAATTSTQVGVGYRPKTANSDDGVASTSLTMAMYIGKEGTYVQGKGMRGTFDIAFVHGDRALINFTFQGVLDKYVEGSSALPSDYNYTMEVPPAFTASALEFGGANVAAANWAGALFNSINFTLGNEMAVRENSNVRAGYKSAIITGRQPQLTFNPDMTNFSQDSSYDFWASFLSGTETRLRWNIGTTAGNLVTFRCAAAQFTGITDGERDTVSIIDSTTALTGGSYGSSVIANGGAQTSSTLGADNEFQILFRNAL